MEFLVPLLILVVVCVVGFLIFRAVSRKSGSTAAKAPRGTIEVSAEMAQAAAARLTPDQHRAIYSLIAQRQLVPAIRAYRQATGAGLRAAFADVTALEHFPQPTPERTATAPASSAPATPAPATTVVPADFTVDDIVNAAPAPIAAPEPVRAAYRYRAIVSRGDEMREVASTRLNEEIFARIRALALAGEYDGAARLLCDHADIGASEAMEFVRLIDPEP